MRIIEVQNVSKCFNRRRVLSNISLAMEQGEFVGIIGPSGCGKSTLLKIIAGLKEPDQGRVLILGRDIARFNARQRQEIGVGMVFQTPAFPESTVWENLTLVLSAQDDLPPAEIDKRVNQVLEMVNLVGNKDLFVSQLSGGMQKRLSVAMALISQPRIILYDEPTLSLDRLNIEHIRNLMLRIHQDNKGQVTSLLVTHQIDILESLVQRVILLKDGSIQDLGKPEVLEEKGSVELFGQPDDLNSPDEEAV